MSMAKEIKIKDVEELKPQTGFKTVQGKCRFCGQYIALEVPAVYNKQDIEEEATVRCTCPEAVKFAKTQENIANTEGMIRNFFEHKHGLDNLKEMLLSSVKPLAEGQITKITIQKGEYTGTMKPSKDGIKLSLKYSTEDSVES